MTSWLTHRSWPSVLWLLAPLLMFLLLPADAWGQSVGSDTGAFARAASQGVWVAILASFGFGVAASMTGCVLPMVPLTVAVFGATEARSRGHALALSAVFVLGIATLMTGLGVGFALSGKLLGSMLANKWVAVFVALVFLTLAASFFGAFEMALPSGLHDRLANMGGIGFRGAFVLGLVMSLVAMPCTGPFVVGIGAWLATQGSVALGASAMFSFSLGLGLVFFLAGAFAMRLPKGGAWMLGIKWGSAVVLSYMALSYLRDAFPEVRRLVLPTTSYGILGALILLAGIALGVLHLRAERRDASDRDRSRTYKLASIVPAVLGLFMVVSFASAAPAQSAGHAALAWLSAEPEAVAKAEAEKKPLLIDFGAEWCVACKDLEKRTFPHPLVTAQANRFVALRVDATDDEHPEIRRLTKKYRVLGLPTVIVVGSHGQEVLRFTEFVPPERFAEALATVR